MESNPTVFFNGGFMKKEDVCISPDDRGFLFGDGVYEVIKIYEGEPFELDTHLVRLARSLAEVGMKEIDSRQLEKACRSLIEKNDLAGRDASCYIQITRGAAVRKHPFPEKETPLTVYMAVTAHKEDGRKKEQGVKVILRPDIRWNRCDIKSVSLLPNVLACQEARDEEAEEILFVRDGAVTEGSHTNFCAVFDNVLHTHPEGPNILPSVTRDVVLRLCSRLGIETRLYPVLESRLEKADEMMILGTHTEITPVVLWDGKQVGNGKPGPVTRKLQEAFTALTRNR
ncbi:MAG: aminotransferase class IV [Desulfarculaceae bacterium]|nr:aminotransferase class IV [Desulfarculaceae bacterium]